MADTSWTQLASYPNANTVGAIAYAEGNKIYCIHGFGTGFTADVLCYDIATDTWTSIDRPNRRDEMAMAGAKEPDKVQAALDSVRETVFSMLK